MSQNVTSRGFVENGWHLPYQCQMLECENHDFEQILVCIWTRQGPVGNQIFNLKSWTELTGKNAQRVRLINYWSRNDSDECMKERGRMNMYKVIIYIQVTVRRRVKWGRDVVKNVSRWQEMIWRRKGGGINEGMTRRMAHVSWKLPSICRVKT